MLKLYDIHDTETNTSLGKYHCLQKLAKAERISMNDVDDDGYEILRYVVVPGPDNRNRHELIPKPTKKRI